MKKLSELKKLPRPISIDLIKNPEKREYRLKIFFRPDFDEIIEEAKRRGYDDYEDGEFKKTNKKAKND
jgi:hypothetical protein